MTNGRIFIDVSTMCRSTGQPVGIVRVERELARWAKENLPGAVFVFYETRTRRYWEVADRWIGPLVAGDVVVDSWTLPEATGRRRFIDRVPEALRPAARFLLRSRRQLLLSLEERRLQAADPAAAERLDRLQRRFMTPKYAAWMIAHDGTRRPWLSATQLLTRPAEPGPGDVVLNAGAGWAHTGIDHVRELKERGVLFALVVFDLMPVLFPQYYSRRDVEHFTRYMEAAIPAADLVLVSARRIGEDVRAFAERLGSAMPRIVSVPFGFDLKERAAGPAGPLPEGLAAGRYVLFVSTVEPRKGHRLLLRAWRRLLETGIPQAHDFRLVFVGRVGWMVEELVDEIAAMENDEGRVVHLAGLHDAALDALYAQAAFCVYPSEYEGFGLPVIEAFGHGKPVISSDGGALPETMGGLGPCLPVGDVEAWASQMGRWIAEPAARAEYETAVRTRFRRRSWDEAAREIFAAVLAMAGTAGRSPAPGPEGEGR